jgi:hypothetical protein
MLLMSLLSLCWIAVIRSKVNRAGQDMRSCTHIIVLFFNIVVFPSSSSITKIKPVRASMLRDMLLSSDSPIKRDEISLSSNHF